MIPLSPRYLDASQEVLASWGFCNCRVPIRAIIVELVVAYVCLRHALIASGLI